MIVFTYLAKKLQKKAGRGFFNFAVLRHLYIRGQISAQRKLFEFSKCVCCVKLINQFFSERGPKMSNENNVSKELTEVVNKVLSRREAVKKAGSIAAGAALAFLGLGLPGISQQKEAKGCGRCCQGGCQDSCYYWCDGCTGTCYGTCEYDCGGDCTGTCLGNCEGCCTEVYFGARS